jgi:hypothetical protein
MAAIRDAAAWPAMPALIVAGHPHHVTQRGNGCARTFSDADYALYRDLLAERHPTFRRPISDGRRRFVVIK